MKTSQPRTAAPDLRRRAFLGLITTGGVASSLGCVGLLTNVALMGTRLKEFTATTFEPHVGSRFILHGDKDGPLSVELIESQGYPFDPERPAHVRREPFTLIFHAARQRPFEDQTCRISHPRLGTIEAFLSCVDLPEQGMNLQAVFG